MAVFDRTEGAERIGAHEDVERCRIAGRRGFEIRDPKRCRAIGEILITDHIHDRGRSRGRTEGECRRGSKYL
ncbi:hypothetical protein JT55_06455 [Rhodovulum sp. NI22]|nr:hypothetical protein JT55_06455 [Rhodovulum sp. NI22]